MEIKKIKMLAKNINANPDELSALVGADVIIDRLLAKNPNATAEMLDQLSCGGDEAVCRSVVIHPNIGRDTLVRLAQKYPKIFFRNTSISEILLKDPLLPLSFEQCSLQKMLQDKSCPEALAIWTLRHGELWHQAAYVCKQGKPLSIMKLFFDSQFPAIVSAVIKHNDDAYIQWAEDLGYSPTQEELEQDAADGMSPRASAEFFILSLCDKVDELWNELVPKQGSASSLQGELCRAIGRLEGEYWKNLFMNWGDGSNYYENLLDFICKTLTSEKMFSSLVIKIIEADVQTIKDFANSEDSLDQVDELKQKWNFLLGKDCDIEETAFPRIKATIAAWCVLHPEPIINKA